MNETSVTIEFPTEAIAKLFLEWWKGDVERVDPGRMGFDDALDVRDILADDEGLRYEALPRSFMVVGRIEKLDLNRLR